MGHAAVINVDGVENRVSEWDHAQTVNLIADELRLFRWGSDPCPNHSKEINMEPTDRCIIDQLKEEEGGGSDAA